MLFYTPEGRQALTKDYDSNGATKCHQDSQRADCDQACRLTMNGSVRASGGQGKPLPMTSEGEWSRHGDRPGQRLWAGVNLASLRN